MIPATELFLLLIAFSLTLSGTGNFCCKMMK